MRFSRRSDLGIYLFGSLDICIHNEFSKGRRWVGLMYVYGGFRVKAWDRKIELKVEILRGLTVTVYTDADN